MTTFWAFYGLTGIAIGTLLWDTFKSLMPDIEPHEREHKIGMIMMVAILWPVLLIMRK